MEIEQILIGKNETGLDEWITFDPKYEEYVEDCWNEARCISEHIIRRYEFMFDGGSKKYISTIRMEIFKHLLNKHKKWVYNKTQ